MHLHKHDTASMDPLIKKLAEYAIPLWNRTLSPFKTNRVLPPRISDWSNSRDDVGYSMDDRERPEQESDEEDGDFDDRLDD